MAIRIMGINLSHDSSVCLVEDGVVVGALALERTTQHKRGTVPWHEYTLAMTQLAVAVVEEAGHTLDEIDYWVATSTESRDQADEERLLDILGALAPAGKRLSLPHPAHHLAHASAAFYTAGMTDAAALVIDTYGSLIDGGRERETAFEFAMGRQPHELWRTARAGSRIAGSAREGEIALPVSIDGVGELYRMVTLALGFRERGTSYDDAGKTMGLAPYGKRISDQNLFVEAVDGELNFGRAKPSLIDLGFAEQIGDGERLLPRAHGAPIEQRHRDLACQIQVEFEAAVLHLAAKTLEFSESRNLVLSGGCFLNSTANTKLARELDLDRISVFPAATDDGNAAGAALYAYHNLLDLTRRSESAMPPKLANVYLGPARTSAESVMGAVKTWEYEPCRQHADDHELARSAAQAIARGEIIGWFQDHAEFGPRSLGARSILCHPGIAGMKDRLNARVKFREAFRPFAASVLAEDAHDWFDMPVDESPFMLFVCPAIADRRSRIEEVVHVDGTCRIQTVDRSSSRPFRLLIEAFGEQTGIPMVLNTSFNLRTKPIVETAGDALNCLFGSRLDRLFVGGYEFEAPRFDDMVPVQLATASRDRLGMHLPPRDSLVLQRLDGVRPCRRVAEVAGLGVDETVDVILDLRRKGYLDWLGKPARYTEHHVPTPHYQEHFRE